MLFDHFEQIVAPDKIKIFYDFLNKKDNHVDDRGNVYNKLMTPAMPGWPVQELKELLDQVLPHSYVIENADFVRMKFHSRLHTDTADGDQNRLYKNVIIPLEENGDAETAIFPNKWFGPAAKFTKVEIPQFQYTINNLDGQEILVDDIKLLLEAVEKKSGLVKYQGHDFDIDPTWLRELVAKRQQVDLRVNDYHGISNLTDQEFPEDFRQQHLSHIPAATLRGLGLPHLARWRVGDVITFDRQHLHSGTSTLKTSKSFLAVFTWHE